MVGLVLGIIVLISGIVSGIVFSLYIEHKGEKFVKPLKKYSKCTIIGGVVLGIIITGFGCISSVDTGKTGVVTTFGRVEEYTYEAGFHIKAPWNKVIEMDNRVQKATVKLSCFSSDIQEVNMQYTLNYQINKANAQEIYRTIGEDYYNTIISPTISESVKVATARYTAEQLVQNRNELAYAIETILEESLERYNIKISSTAIEDMDFTDAFTNAVESKQVAEQKKKQAEIEQAQALLQAENEKRIAKTKAEAEAEVAKIQAEADMEVAKIGADSAEYQGKKEASIALQRLASINGWTVISSEETGLNKLYKADGTEVSAEELKVGAENLIRYYYTQQWDGKLPETLLGDEINALFNLG